MPRLFELTRQLEELYDKITVGEDGEISPDMMAELNAIQEPWSEKADNIAGLIRNLETEADAFKAEADRMAAKSRAMNKRVDNLKEYLKTNLETLQIDSVKGSRFKISLCRNSKPTVCVPMLSHIPLKYVVHPDPVPNKTAILEAIMAGETVSGVEIVNGRHVRIS